MKFGHGVNLIKHNHLLYSMQILCCMKTFKYFFALLVALQMR